MMDSIIRNYPLPAIFVDRNQRDGDVVYDGVFARGLDRLALSWGVEERAGQFRKRRIIFRRTRILRMSSWIVGLSSMIRI